MQDNHSACVDRTRIVASHSGRDSARFPGRSPRGTLQLIVPDGPQLGVVDRIDGPLPGLFALSLRGDEPRVLLVFAGAPRARPAWAIARERPRGAPADAIVRGLRDRLEGTRVVQAVVGRSLSLFVRAGDHELWVAADRSGVQVDEPIDGMLPEGRPLTEADLADAEARASRLLAEHRALLVDAKRRALEAALGKVATKLERRISAVEEDLSRAEDASEDARVAALFVAEATRMPRGTTLLHATDWSSGAPVERTLTLDPAAPPRVQLERVFARAKRLRAGAALARARRDEAETWLLTVLEARDELQRLADEHTIDALAERIRRALPRDLAPKPQGSARARPAQGGARRHREFESVAGSPLFVGKDATSNDHLSTVVARPGDLWLHARDAAGAHVVAPGWFKSGRLEQETLVDAATLAAHFSDLRGEAVVDVRYADRRHVRKRRGAPPGTVEVTREKVLPVRIERERLTRLLASERS